MLINWVKCPSVTYGGKDYFYTAETPKGRHWVSWNRQTLVYDITCDKLNYPLVNTGFKTPQKAMKWLGDKLNETANL